MHAPRLRAAALAALVGATLASGVAGCTSNSDTTPDASDSSTPLAESTTSPFVTETCIDGNASVVLDEKTTDVTFSEACDSVDVIGSGGTVTLTDVNHLVVEGTGITVTAGSVGTVDFAGDGNTVSHTGAEPVVNDNGTADNTVTAR
ncbi:DUF3060 domain-containing protein [Frigoribacterium sp. VKM Ac-2836]|uniref:DUF3060 domain-containing protein n=1 Tax=Frigoribacterium sp. VKM Ac-2836 TaxID=2739014 RepID=UPI001564FF02|nr:DUF3060 domain-containing protein [Frigoribacterium sp. VKM Ac-2836]NRD27878.1 DUF3060 domain-containing protein [Frigoribacterium sp. VKM Ac-2836]